MDDAHPVDSLFAELVSGKCPELYAAVDSSLWSRLMSGESPDLDYPPEVEQAAKAPTGNVAALRAYKATGDVKVRNALVLDNMRLVYDQIYKFTKRRSLRRDHKGRQSDPLVSAGVCGLIRAIELFDISMQKDNRSGLFVVYARLHIWHELQQSALQDKGVSKRILAQGLTKLDMQEIIDGRVYDHLK